MKLVIFGVHGNLNILNKWERQIDFGILWIFLNIFLLKEQLEVEIQTSI